MRHKREGWSKSKGRHIISKRTPIVCSSLKRVKRATRGTNSCLQQQAICNGSLSLHSITYHVSVTLSPRNHCYRLRTCNRVSYQRSASVCRDTFTAHHHKVKVYEKIIKYLMFFIVFQALFTLYLLHTGAAGVPACSCRYKASA